MQGQSKTNRLEGNVALKYKFKMHASTTAHSNCDESLCSDMEVQDACFYEAVKDFKKIEKGSGILTDSNVLGIPMDYKT
jgi:hypothetical protein